MPEQDSQDSPLLASVRKLAVHISDFFDPKVHKATADAVDTKLQLIMALCRDGDVTFNASEQIRSLTAARKELDLLVDDFMSAREAHTLTETRYDTLMQDVHKLSEVILTISDPEYS